MTSHEKCENAAPEPPAQLRAWLPGLMIAYLIMLAYLILHGAGLTTAAIIIYAHLRAGQVAASFSGLNSFVPLGFLIFYVLTNVVLIVYGAWLYPLTLRRRRSAIINNIICNALGILFLVSWHLLGEKSNIGTVVDILPNLAGISYFLLSRKAKAALVTARG